MSGSRATSSGLAPTLLALLLLAPALSCVAQTQTNAANTNTNRAAVAAPSTTNTVSADVLAERLRTECVQGRRYVCGRVLQILPDGLVIDSGYTELLNPPLNQTWVSPGTVTLKRDPNVLELNAPDAVCIGPVFLTDIPKRPKVKQYDYVVIHGYPAGQITYAPVPGITKTVRRFSAGLETAVRLNLEAATARKSP